MNTLTPKNLSPRAARQARIQKNRELLRRDSSAYGGALYNTRNNRHRARPLSFHGTMHLVLRSSQARGEQSFLRPQNKKKIESALKKFTKKHSIKIITWANVGNHLHFHLKLNSRASYKAFIRAFTSAIVMAVAKTKLKRFWDHRPFSRAVRGSKYFQTLNDYIWINHLEGHGQKRSLARFFVELTNAKIFDQIGRAHV